MKISVKNLWVFGMVAALAAAAPAQDIIVDEGDGAPTYTETGEWSATSNVGAGYNGGIYRFTSSNRAFSTCTWTPVIPADGAYEVFAIFRRSADRTSNAPYSIVHADGTATRSLDQTGVFSGDLSYDSLGAYRFTAGTGGSVTMSNDGGTGAYIADAMAFVPDTAPAISDVKRSPLYPGDNQSVLVTANVTDNGTVDSVVVDWAVTAAGASGMVAAVDDGTAGDATAGDGVYTATIPGRPADDAVTFSITATDSLASSSTSPEYNYTVGETGTWRLVINEILASNSSTNADPDFAESGDWVEIYNVGPNAADLTGHTLSDNASDPAKWAFPAGAILNAGEYMVVWCDDHDTVGTALHTNFKLSAGGEAVVLSDNGGTRLIDSITYEALGTDEAFARIPNIDGAFEKTILPTPGAENERGLRGDAPTFSVSSGFFTAPIEVEISAPGAASIRYELDGSTPDATSTVYTGPLTISSTTGLRAQAIYDTVAPSTVTTASYFYTSEPDRQIPVINLVVDPDDLFDPSIGIYPNFEERGDAWERPAHVSIISPDGSDTQSFDAGLRIHGGFSRSAAKRSFRLYFRGEYGPSAVSIPYMKNSPATEIDQMVLRAGGNDGFLVTDSAQLREVTLIRDQLMRDWYREQGNYAADGFFAALYLNGEYWGLYNATERITDDQMGEIYGGGSDYDIVKGTWTFATKFYTEATDGDLNAWAQFLAWHAASEVATAAGLDELKTRIDYRNFLDFFALNIFCQNEDWPHNNWIASRHRTNPDAKWVFHEWDSEWGLGLRPQGSTSDTMQWAMGNNFHLSASHNGTIAPLSSLFNGNDVDTNRTSDIDGILDNPEGRRDYLVSVEDLLNFEVPPQKAIAQFDAYANLIASEIPREAARWASSTGSSANTLVGYWTSASARLRLFLADRPDFFRNLLLTKLSVAGTRTITFEATGDGTGRLALRGRTVDLPWTGTFFDQSPLELSARPTNGSSFEGWSGLVSGSEPELATTISNGTAASVVLNFGTGIVPTPQPNSVIFNEYWVNDNATTYTTVNAPIDRDWVELLVVEDGTDMRGWRITGNEDIATSGSLDSGSIYFPQLPVLESLRAGTIILVVASINDVNTASFPEDDLDATDRRLIFYAGNGNLDVTTDPNFGIGSGDDALILLAPGQTGALTDDVGIDFIAEGTRITPESFFGTATPPITFSPAFAGIGGDDGAVFLNDPSGSFNNDNGADEDRSDFLPGTGGWIVDPPSAFSGDSDPIEENYLTPGAPNHGQNLESLYNGEIWVIR